MRINPDQILWEPLTLTGSPVPSLYNIDVVRSRLLSPASSMNDAISTPGVEAAVLLLLLETEHPHELRVLFTQRSLNLKQHAGQVSFPGGKKEPADPNLLTTALRETEEEVGISTHHIEYICQLPSHDTQTGFTVTPFVGYAHQAAIQIDYDEGEVAQVFTVPLNYCLDLTHFKQYQYHTGSQQRTVYAIDWQGFRIWGATAAILMSLYRRLHPTGIHT